MSNLGRNVLEFYGTVGVPVVYALGLYMITFTSTLAGVYQMGVGVILAIVGLLLWTVSYVQLGKSFGVLPRQQKRVKKGVYKYLNHPMYVGIITTYVGLAFALGSYQGMIYIMFVLVPLLVYRSKQEAKRLED